jgi:hypothetical protein
VVPPCLVAFTAAGLIVASSLVSQPTNTFELAKSVARRLTSGATGQRLIVRPP